MFVSNYVFTFDLMIFDDFSGFTTFIFILCYFNCFSKSSRNQGSGRTENEHEKYVRLFVIVPKNMTEEDLRSEFEEYGPLESVSMIRDKVTRECKGFAYVKFFK